MIIFFFSYMRGYLHDIYSRELTREDQDTHAIQTHGSKYTLGKSNQTMALESVPKVLCQQFNILAGVGSPRNKNVKLYEKASEVVWNFLFNCLFLVFTFYFAETIDPLNETVMHQNELH